MKAYREIDRCRLCGNQELTPILSLGRQALTGVFPRTKDEPVTAGPLELVKCAETRSGGACGLVQLRQSYDKWELYGLRYGYRSGLNPSMVEHLQGVVQKLLAMVSLRPGELVVDIGSNDGTLLKAYPRGPVLAGVDPTGEQFRRYYPKRVRLMTEFFSSGSLRRSFGEKKAKIVTSIALFYDLDSPMEFVAEVRNVLADDGVWVLEQSYLPAMVEKNAYDTVCHEHLEYYGLRQIKWMTDRLGLKIVAVELNDVNGGSFSVTVAKDCAPYPECARRLKSLLGAERKYSSLAVYRGFEKAVLRHREKLLDLLRKIKARGETIAGYGASTKGNVILQFCGLGPRDIPRIGEVNPDKFGCFTPGTLIPIVPETEVRASRPDYLLVLPWHFKDFIVRKEADYLRSGGGLLFPLPRLEVCR